MPGHLPGALIAAIPSLRLTAIASGKLFTLGPKQEEPMSNVWYMLGFVLSKRVSVLCVPLVGLSSAATELRNSVLQHKRMLMPILLVYRPRASTAFHHGMSDSDDDDYGFDSSRDSGSNFY